MKSVLISIKPKGCEKIAAEEQIIELRKTRPNVETPFKCYIYETKDTKGVHGFSVLGRYRLGKVIGEFICDRIEMVNAKCSDYGIDLFYHDCLTKGYLTEKEVEEYFNIPEDKDLRAMKGNGYVWYISDLKIYDKPKELSEFYTKKKCNSCKKSGYESIACMYDEDCKVPVAITRPPQSYMYVEEVENE